MRNNPNDKSWSKKIIIIDKQGNVKSVDIKREMKTFKKKILINSHRPKPDTDTEEARGFRPKR